MQKITTTFPYYKYPKRYFNKLIDNSQVIFLNNLYPFFNFVKRLPKSFFEMLEELDELHEIELYDRIFIIKQAKKELTKISLNDRNILIRMKNNFLIFKNRLRIYFNNCVLKICYKTSFLKEEIKR